MKRKALLTPVRRLGSRLALVVAIFAISSCITVNVNFPESAVQSAADNFVRDLYKSTPTTTSAGANADADAAAVKNSVKKPPRRKSKTPAVQPATIPQPTTWNVYFWMPLAFAGPSPDLVMDTPRTGAVKGRMSARLPELMKWKKAGAVCETKDGLVMLDDASKAGPQAPAVAKLVKEENSDREELYDEVTSANQITATNHKERVRQIFSEAFLRNSPHPCK